MLFSKFLAVVALQAAATTANPLGRAAPPTVTLDIATFTGTSSGRVSKFLGIPFAQPPIGDRRFRLPAPIGSYVTARTATSFGPACPQQAIQLPILTGLAQDAVDFILNSIYGLIFPESEDCLTINVVKPATATATSKLPVVVWIFGGGFEVGSPTIYDGGVIVDRSISLGEPVIFVSMNYRVSAWGFLAGKEVKDAGVGNLGMQDQREALRWIQKYIGAFGGDPSKVTIWGESAGAISVGLHMVTNGGNNENLFRGAFMQSGSPIPVGDISHGQVYYDSVVKNTGCGGSSDTLQCLRGVPEAVLKAAVNKTPGIFAYQSLVLAWLPRVDGKFLVDNPQKLVQQGSVANVPFVTGDCDDEGTLFSLSTLNVTDTAGLKKYIKGYWLPSASDSDIDKLLSLYPDNILEGSPFDTGVLNALSWQFKRIAAFQGDAVFQAPRRFFLQQTAGKQNSWAYLNKRLKGLPVLGSAHGTDILNSFGSGDLGDAVINFANKLDPNGDTLINWPKWTPSSLSLMTFWDGLIGQTITKDTYRKEAMDFLTSLTLANPLRVGGT